MKALTGIGRIGGKMTVRTGEFAIKDGELNYVMNYFAEEMLIAVADLDPLQIYSEDYLKNWIVDRYAPEELYDDEDLTEALVQ
jgi:hypothetical protein